MKRTWLAFIFFIVLIPLFGQRNTNQTAILAPIHTLFRAMELGDSAMLGTAFYKEVTLKTLKLDDGTSLSGLTTENDLSAFKNAIASAGNNTFREPIYSVRINSEGSFAQVWARYSFYLNDIFHHCGIDTFQLLKTSAGWKIFYLADTRQVSGCVVPASIRKKFAKREGR